MKTHCVFKFLNIKNIIYYKTFTNFSHKMQVKVIAEVLEFQRIIENNICYLLFFYPTSISKYNYKKLH